MSKDKLSQLPYEVYFGDPPKRSLRNRIRGVFFDSMVTINLAFCSFLAYDLDRRNPTTPDFLQGRIVDIIGTAANAALVKTIYGLWPSWNPALDIEEWSKGTRFESIANKLADNRPLVSALTVFIGQTNWEVMQGLGIIPGTYDPGDFIAYGVGALGFVGLNYGAKYLGNKFGDSISHGADRASRLPKQILSRFQSRVSG